MDSARVIQVIESTLLRRGKGTEDDPIRIVTQYFALDGTLLAESDPVQAAHASELPFTGIECRDCGWLAETEQRWREHKCQ